MKICKYCGTANANDAKECEACHAREFSYKCDRCGTKFDSSFCPNCGIKGGADPQPEHSRDAVEKTVVEHHVIIDQRQPEPQKKKHTFWIVVLWIFFLPVMAILAIWKAKKIPKLWKIILTVAIAFITLLYGIGTTRNAEDAAQTVAPLATVVPTAAPTEEPEAEPTAEAVVEPTAEPEAWVGNEAAVAAMKDLLDQSFPGKNKVEIDADMKAYSVSVWADGTAQIAYLASTGDSKAKGEWDDLKESIPIGMAALKIAAENVGEQDAHIWYSVLNDGNTENALYIVFDGTVIYDAVG